MPTSGRLDTLDTKSGGRESGGGEDDRAKVWGNGETGDVLAPFFMSPSAQTAMRTLSSWPSRSSSLDDELDIVDERQSSATHIHVFE